LLARSAPVSWSARDVLRVQGPQTRRLQVELDLRIDSLDHAGAVARSVKDRLVSFFDTATGGPDKVGWELGASPREEDIALALGGAPYLESIEDVKLYEATEDGEVQPWSATLKTTEIAILGDDPVRIHFTTAEAIP
jgi:hypothetical protein